VTLFGPLLGESNPPPEVAAQQESLRSRLLSLRPAAIKPAYATFLDLKKVQVQNPEDLFVPSPRLLTVQTDISYSERGCVMAVYGEDLSMTMRKIGQICFRGKSLDVGHPLIAINLGSNLGSDQSWHSNNVPPFLSVAISALDAQSRDLL
jgi:hypothetical protein